LTIWYPRDSNGIEIGAAANTVKHSRGGFSQGARRGDMLVYFKILVSCTIVGILLATIFITPGGVLAGALKGLLVGMLIAWGEWKSSRKEIVVSFVRH
jgi:hypothetical protein